MTQTDDDADVLGEEDLPPTPRTPWLVIALIILNLTAALAFAFLLLKDLDARHSWAYEVMKRDVLIQGIPLKEEEAPPAKAALAAQAAGPRLTLEPEWLEKAYKDRTGKSLQDKFLPARLDPQHIRPQDLSEDLLTDLFGNYGKEPVATQDAEIARVKANLPKWIDAATEGAAKKAKDKRDLLYEYLLPLTHLTDNKDQVAELDRAVKAANAKQLDELVADAARRKLLVDLLLRLEEFRPHNPKAKEDKLLHAAALEPKGQAVGLTKERYQVKTDELMDLLNKRVDETLAEKDVHGARRHDLEKRRCVAFLLFNLGQFPGADGTPLYPQGRAEVVCGVREYTQAADTTALVLERLEKRALDAIRLDRGPYLYPLDYRVHDPAKFADKVTELLEEMGALPRKDDAKADPNAIKRREEFRKAVQAEFTKQLKQMKTDDKETAGQKALNAVTKLMKDRGVAITEDKDVLAAKLKVKQTLFERAVVRMTDGYEPGFVAAHHELINLIRELSGRIQEMDNRLKELQDQATKLDAEYKERLQHKAGVEKRLVAAREKTLKLADDLARLQDERFRAQVELADADRRNLLYERRIRELEQSRKKGKRAEAVPMNAVGKALVLVNLLLSLVLLAWALLLIIHPVDYAWKEPRKVWGPGAEGKKEPNDLLASRIDERVAGYEKLRAARANAVAWARQAKEKLDKVSGGFGYNHREYVREADRLWDAPSKIPIAEIKYNNKDGTLAVPNDYRRWWETPIWDQPVPGVNKSYKQYVEDLKKKAKEIEIVSMGIEKLHEQQKQVTVRLNGERGKDGKVVEPGYYDLLEAEAEAYKKLKEELEYLQPLWVMELYNAQLLRARRQGLAKRLVELGGDPSAIQLK